jgi:hypothetical protein
MSYGFNQEAIAPIRGYNVLMQELISVIVLVALGNPDGRIS